MMKDIFKTHIRALKDTGMADNIYTVSIFRKEKGNYNTLTGMEEETITEFKNIKVIKEGSSLKDLIFKGFEFGDAVLISDFEFKLGDFLTIRTKNYEVVGLDGETGVINALIKEEG